MDGMAPAKTARPAHGSLASLDVDDLDYLENLPRFRVRSANCVRSVNADATLRDRPSIRRIISHLVAHALITKHETPGERRAFGLHITPAGHALTGKVRAIVKNQSDDFFADVPERDRDEPPRIPRNIYRKIRKGRAK